MDELQTGVEQTLAVLPQPPVLLQPRKATLCHPTLGHDLERMQLASFGDLHRDLFAQDVLHALSERLAYIAGCHAAEPALGLEQACSSTLPARPPCGPSLLPWSLLLRAAGLGCLLQCAV